MARDVVLSAFACSTMAPCGKWAKELFREEPLVLTVPGSGGDFIKRGREWAATGDAFRAALKELAPQHKNIEIHRRALVTFSAGWQLGDEILKSKADREALDSYLVEDGIHTKGLDHWIKFAMRAGRSEALMVMAHTQIVPPFISTKETNTTVFNEAVARLGANANPYGVEPECMTKPKFPAEGVSIRSGNPPTTRKWTADPLVASEWKGDLFRFEYEGKDGPSHMYIAWHVAPRLWQMLATRWNVIAIPTIEITGGDKPVGEA
jgi:hypothetical protein